MGVGGRRKYQRRKKNRETIGKKKRIIKLKKESPKKLPRKNKSFGSGRKTPKRALQKPRKASRMQFQRGRGFKKALYRGGAQGARKRGHGRFWYTRKGEVKTTRCAKKKEN